MSYSYYSIEINSNDGIILTGYFTVLNDVITEFYDIQQNTNLIADTNDDNGADNLFINGNISSNGTAITNMFLLDKAYRATEWVFLINSGNPALSYKQSNGSWTELVDSYIFTITSINEPLPLYQPTPSPGFYNSNVIYDGGSICIGYFYVGPTSNVITRFYDVNHSDILSDSVDNDMADAIYVDNKFSYNGVSIINASGLDTTIYQGNEGITTWSLWTGVKDYMSYQTFENPSVWTNISDIHFQNNALSAAEIISNGFTLTELINVKGFSLTELKYLGFTATDLKNEEFTATELKTYFTLAQLVDASYSAINLHDASYTAIELKPYFSLQQLIDVNYSVYDLYTANYTARELKSFRYSANDLKDYYSLADLIGASYLIINLRDAGFSASQLKDQGYSAFQLKDYYSLPDLIAAAYSVMNLKYAWFSAIQLKEQGYSANQLKNDFLLTDLIAASYSVTNLRDAGFSVSQLKQQGFSAAQLKDDYSLSDLITASYSIPNLIDANFSITQLKQQGYSATQLKYYYSLAALIDANYSISNLRDAGFLAAQLSQQNIQLSILVQANYSAGELKQAGFSAMELKNQQFTLGQLLIANYSINELRIAGFSAAELKEQNFNLSQLISANYTAAELKSAGYSARELLQNQFNLRQLVLANYSASELKQVGFSAIQLRAEQFVLADLVAASYTVSELTAAGFSDVKWYSIVVSIPNYTTPIFTGYIKVNFLYIQEFYNREGVNIMTQSIESGVDNVFSNGNISSNGTSISSITLLDKLYRASEWVLSNNGAMNILSYKSNNSWINIPNCTFIFTLISGLPLYNPISTPGWFLFRLSYTGGYFDSYFNVSPITNTITGFYDYKNMNKLVGLGGNNNDRADNTFINNKLSPHGVIISSIPYLTPQYNAVQWTLWTVTIDSITTNYLSYKNTQGVWTNVTNLTNIHFTFEPFSGPYIHSHSLQIFVPNYTDPIFTGHFKVNTFSIEEFYNDNDNDSANILTNKYSKNSDNLFINGKFTTKGTSISKIALLDRKYRPEEWVLSFDNNTSILSYKTSSYWFDISGSFSYDTINTTPILYSIQSVSTHTTYSWHTLNILYNNTENIFLGYFKVDNKTHIIENFYDTSYNNILLKNEDYCDYKYIDNHFTTYGVCISSIPQLSHYPATKWALWSITIDGTTQNYLAYKRNPWITVEDFSNVVFYFNEIENFTIYEEPPPSSCVCILSKPLPQEKPQKNHSQQTSRQRWAKMIQSNPPTNKPDKTPLPNRYVMGLANGKLNTPNIKPNGYSFF